MDVAGGFEAVDGADVGMIEGRQHPRFPREPRQAVRIAKEGTVIASDGSEIAVQAQTICIHGDSPGAVQIAKAVRDRLVANGVTLAAFV